MTILKKLIYLGFNTHTYTQNVVAYYGSDFLKRNPLLKILIILY